MGRIVMICALRGDPRAFPGASIISRIMRRLKILLSKTAYLPTSSAITARGFTLAKASTNSRFRSVYPVIHIVLQFARPTRSENTYCQTTRHTSTSSARQERLSRTHRATCLLFLTRAGVPSLGARSRTQISRTTKYVRIYTRGRKTMRFYSARIVSRPTSN